MVINHIHFCLCLIEGIVVVVDHLCFHFQTLGAFQCFNQSPHFKCVRGLFESSHVKLNKVKLDTYHYTHVSRILSVSRLGYPRLLKIKKQIIRNIILIKNNITWLNNFLLVCEFRQIQNWTKFSFYTNHDCKFQENHDQ